MLGILPNLTKKYILNSIPQEEIFARYSGVPAHEINECVESNTLIHSPLRADNDPTCGFYCNREGKLKMRDFNGYFWGDCFDIVAYRLNLDANYSNHFAVILDRIAKDFKIHKYKDADEGIKYEKNQVLKKKEYVHFDFEFRTWNKHDAKYWIGLSKTDLEAGLVYPVRHLFVNKQVSYIYRDNDVAYAYYLGQEKWKVYFPMRGKGKRFMCNSGSVQGINTFKGGKIGIITKSYKDVIYLRKFRDKYNIDSIAPSSETDLITPNQFGYLSKKIPTWLSLMDYDNTGIRMACLLRKHYKIPPLFLREGTWARKKGLSGCKDFSDYVHLHGIEKGEELLVNFIKPYLC